MDDADAGLGRRQAFLATLPFVGLGVADLLLLLEYGLDPLWGFMILPPIAMMSVLAWIAFRGGLARDRVGDPREG
jgi:cobalamin synthase